MFYIFFFLIIVTIIIDKIKTRVYENRCMNGETRPSYLKFSLLQININFLSVIIKISMRYRIPQFRHYQMVKFYENLLIFLLFNKVLRVKRG